ncbi:MAG: arylsulfatase [Capsulimonadales bacterium]|nr:arylsulfatase [Capsulimonadales bacterium]
MKPNIVLINVDQWRGDCLSAAGHPVVDTPYLDQLAGEGVRFDRAYTAVPSCIPSRVALHTGLSQRSHGRVGYRDGVPWNYETTLAGEFTRHGYQTQAIGKMHVYPERTQLGFQNVILHDGYLHFVRQRNEEDGRTDDYLPWLRQRLGRDADYFDHGVNCNSQVARPWDKPEDTHPTNWITSQGIDFLRRRDPRKPFFLFLSYHRPHPPYDPPAWAFEQYLTREMPEPPRGEWIEHFRRFDNAYRADPSFGRLSATRHRRARAGYYGLITHLDHQINRLLEMLAAYGAARETFVCFVSDHGEMLGDHDFWRKSVPYEGSARVPLLLKGPAGAGIRRGAQCDAVIELRDILPTLLDCAGLPIPEAIDGRSFLPLARGQEVTDWRPWLHGEHTVFGGAMHWLTDGREKYVWRSWDGHEQLFDMVADPQEERDLARLPERADRMAYWRAGLIAELAERPEGFVASGQLVAGRPVTPQLPVPSGTDHRV